MGHLLQLFKVIIELFLMIFFIIIIFYPGFGA